MRDPVMEEGKLGVRTINANLLLLVYLLLRKTCGTTLDLGLSNS
jgi:hypothetical protein